MQPVRWEAKEELHWELDRRCPDCEWRGTGIHPQAECDRYDDALEVATDHICADLTVLVAASLADEVECFRAALEADALLPCDF